MVYPQVSLGELCIDKPQYGANAKAITRTSPCQPRYIRITDIDTNGQLIENGVTADISDPSGYMLRKGDLLIARSGNTVGKSYLRPIDAEPSLFAGYLIRFRLATKRINPRYAFFYTKSERYNAWLDSKRRVAGQPNINGTEYASLEIPLPPLPEQHRIVEILDQADALRQQRRQADALSQRILPALFQEMFGRSDFPIVSIGDLAASERNSIRTGPFGSQLLHSEFSGVGDVAVLGIDNVVTNEFQWDRPRFISIDRYKALQRYTVRPRDILVTIMGSCGRCAIAPLAQLSGLKGIFSYFHP